MSHLTLEELFPVTRKELEEKSATAAEVVKKTNLQLLQMRSLEIDKKFKVIIRTTGPDQEETVITGSDLRSCLENAHATHKANNKSWGANLNQTAEAFIILPDQEVRISSQEEILLRPS